MRKVAVVVILGGLMSVMDTTIVNVALHDLSVELRAPLGTIQWVVTGYFLSLAAVLPITGWAVRKFGARRLYLGALVAFTGGSALCALATNSTELILFRVIQGGAGGTITPVGQMMLAKTAGPRSMPKAMSFIAVPIVLAPIFGPTLGGLLLQTVGWQWIFLINVPIGAVALLLAWRLLPGDDRRGEVGRLDLLGLILAAGGVVGIIYGLSESQTAGSLTARSVLIPIVVGFVLLLLFVMRSSRIREPLLDLSLFRTDRFAAASIATFSLGAAVFGAMILLPLYFETARGYSPVATGLLLVPQGVGGGLGIFASARLTQRLGGGVTSVIGVVILVAATVPFITIADGTPYPAISLAMFGRGAGVGLAVLPTMTAAFSVLTQDQINDASPMLNVLQRIGASLGTALFAVVLQSHLARSPNDIAASFGATYKWVLVVSVAALFPTLWLAKAQRRVRPAAPKTRSDAERLPRAP